MTKIETPWTMAENITETQSNISFSLSVKVEFLQTPTKSEATRGERKAQSVFAAVLDGATGQDTSREFTPLKHNERDGGWAAICNLSGVGQPQPDATGLGLSCHCESRLKTAQRPLWSKEVSLTCPTFHYKACSLFVHHHTYTPHPKEASWGVSAL